MRIDPPELTLLALLALEEVEWRASKEPIPRSWRIRFALAYLVSVGAERRCCLEFWQEMHKAHDKAFSPSTGNVWRAGALHRSIQGIYGSVGIRRTVEMMQLGRDGKITPSNWTDYRPKGLDPRGP